MTLTNVKFLLLVIIHLLFVIKFIECYEKSDKVNDEIGEVFKGIFRDKELEELLDRYLEVAPTSHKTRSLINKLVGLPKPTYVAQPKQFDNKNQIINNTTSFGVQKDLKKVLNYIFDQFKSKKLKCKKKCKPCDHKIEATCEPCHCRNTCRLCPVPKECPIITREKLCPIKLPCKACPLNSKSKPKLTDNKTLNNSTCNCSKKDSINNNTATNITTPIATLTTTTLRPITINSNITLNTTTGRPDNKSVSNYNNNNNNSCSTLSISGNDRSPMLDKRLDLFDFDKNLKILIINSTARNIIEKMFDAIPRKIGGKEMELAIKILARFGDQDSLELHPVGELSQLSYTYMNAQFNIKKVFGFILEAFKRSVCSCEQCTPKKRLDCLPCAEADKRCPSEIKKGKCIERCPSQLVCPVPPGCESVKPCPSCDERDYNNFDLADDDGDPDDLDEIDEEDTVGPDELDSNVPCQGFTCKFEETCGRAELNPLTPKVKRTGYINGGENAIYGEWPSHARIKMGVMISGEKFHGDCSGVLISDKHVLTAAHCLQYPIGKTLQPDEFKVYLGDNDIKEKDNYEVEYNVASVCISRNFVNFRGESTKYDVGVLELAEEVSFNDYIQPACLPYKPLSLTKNSKCFVIGAGATKYYHEGKHESPDIVQKMEVIRTTCKDWGIKHDDRSRHCFKKAEGNGDSCRGDSGGPILCLSREKPKVWTIAGLVSYGSETCDGTESTGWVGVYSRIPTLLQNLNEDCGV